MTVQPDTPIKPFLTVREIAAYLGVHPHTVRRWIHAEELRAVSIGRGYKVRRADLEAFLEARSGKFALLANTQVAS